MTAFGMGGLWRGYRGMIVDLKGNAHMSLNPCPQPVDEEAVREEIRRVLMTESTLSDQSGNRLLEAGSRAATLQKIVTPRGFRSA